MKKKPVSKIIVLLPVIIFVVGLGFFAFYFFSRNEAHIRPSDEVLERIEEAQRSDLTYDTELLSVGGLVYSVEIAETEEQQYKGLSGRDFLDPDAGMIFEFQDAGVYGFWMKGMRFPIDLLWLVDDKVVSIEENISYKDQSTIYSPPEPVNGVLEINAGQVAERGIQIGDTVEYYYPE
ncbi:MAG: hypothetical protein COU08_01525 [Candidatus Harrisonbacteria bacterium CG10_big_fil_rev_8_21_14_0_10_42_17]|uniref:DUF192 domain-containing protein n=1 Tax=Candidatus Harrisonbacteria bacterium CG10_big_fil_rev_8_21_14_0_10_42_17 TaxID=1974584 RepID=A0A2M6WIN5_9BACT|nr:MAG: hypothetical protein COU08_01525 [Candidatus Harrisonbacteria bacterium CG10_big_fil_rev_8_21_14_0_10_42_17]